MSCEHLHPVCASCGAPVVWALSKNGKRMPLNAEPTEDGIFVLEPSAGPVPNARFLTKEKAAETG